MHFSHVRKSMECPLRELKPQEARRPIPPVARPENYQLGTRSAGCHIDHRSQAILHEGHIRENEHSLVSMSTPSCAGVAPHSRFRRSIKTLLENALGLFEKP